MIVHFIGGPWHRHDVALQEPIPPYFEVAQADSLTAAGLMTDREALPINVRRAVYRHYALPAWEGVVHLMVHFDIRHLHLTPDTDRGKLDRNTSEDIR